MYVARRLAFIAVILAGLTLVSVSCQKESDTVEQSSFPLEITTDPSVPTIEVFYSAGPLLNARLQQIALADLQIKTLIEGDSTLTFGDQIIENKNYNFSLGVRLRNDITSDQFNEWIESAREDSELIREYIGVLQIGYNTKYNITFDMEKGIVSELTPQISSGVTIPEISTEEKQQALDIAWADATLQQILEGKQYRVAPDNGIGVWHDGDTKLGVFFKISFDIVYTIDAYVPRYQSDLTHITGEVEGLSILVLLEENRVASIIPISPIVEN